jgi:hypothetical protein
MENGGFASRMTQKGGTHGLQVGLTDFRQGANRNGREAVMGFKSG